MKVIDLLNKIANGEEVPKKIKCEGKIRKYCETDKDYLKWGDIDLYLFYGVLHSGNGEEFVSRLNEEVEIIEEVEITEEDKKIEKLDVRDFAGLSCLELHNLFNDKINEIIDRLEKNNE